MPRPARNSLGINQFIVFSLNNQPGAVPRRLFEDIKPRDRWRHQYQAIRLRALRGTQGHIGTEGKSREPQPCSRPALPSPIDNRKKVFGFTLSVVILPCTFSDTAKIESHRRSACQIDGPDHRMHDLVAHRPVVERMRMANYRKGIRVDRIRLLQQRLQRTRGAGNLCRYWSDGSCHARALAGLAGASDVSTSPFSRGGPKVTRRSPSSGSTSCCGEMNRAVPSCLSSMMGIASASSSPRRSL